MEIRSKAKRIRFKKNPYGNNNPDMLFRHRFKNTQFTHRHFHCWSSVCKWVCVGIYARFFTRSFIHSFVFSFFSLDKIANTSNRSSSSGSNGGNVYFPNVESSTGSQSMSAFKKRDQRDCRLLLFRFSSSAFIASHESFVLVCVAAAAANRQHQLVWPRCTKGNCQRIYHFGFSSYCYTWLWWRSKQSSSVQHG